MAQKGLTPGTVFYVQAWYRDGALQYGKIGLSDALLGIVAP